MTWPRPGSRLVRSFRRSGQSFPGRLRGALGLRTRLVLLTALAVFLSVALAGLTAFGITGRIFVQQADRELAVGPARAVAEAALDARRACILLGQAPPDQLISQQIVVMVLTPEGGVCIGPGITDRPVVVAADRAVARGLAPDSPTRAGESTRGTPLRVLTVPLSGGGALLIARDLSDIRDVLARLRQALFGLTLLGGLIALVVGLAVTRAGLRPVRAVAEIAEYIARTQDLGVDAPTVSGGRSDEVRRLTVAFGKMTAALSSARQRQRQMIADASHELRTPLTSLRTNLDLLIRSERSGRRLPDVHHRELLQDLQTQLDELSNLAADLTVLAHDEPTRARSPVRLDEVVATAVERARLRTTSHVLSVQLQAWTVPDADASALERAVVNVLDNAIKFSPPRSLITIALDDGRLTVDDQGQGIPERQHSQAFERFWRSDTARALPGSGLGLAIVAEVTAAHGGTVEFQQAPGGGTRLALRIPGRPAELT